MKLPENKKKLMEAMEEFMSPDRAKHAVLPISKFGLMQITRQRMKPEMNINTQEVCPSCSGTGKISSTIILEDEIEKNLSYLFTHQHNNLTIVVNPIIHAYLTKGWLWSKFSKWKRKYRKRITLRADTNYHLIEFKFYDRNDDEIRLIKNQSRIENGYSIKVASYSLSLSFIPDIQDIIHLIVTST